MSGLYVLIHAVRETDEISLLDREPTRTRLTATQRTSYICIIYLTVFSLIYNNKSDMKKNIYSMVALIILVHECSVFVLAAYFDMHSCLLRLTMIQFKIRKIFVFNTHSTIAVL